MTQKAKVSVIIPVYNVECFLRQCLDSIVNQTLREIEIICVNDGSTDESPEILAEYAANDGRFRIFAKKNEGLGAASARNYGLDNACGEYVSILDSDDFFELDFLEKMVQKADESSADIVICGGMEYDNRNGKKAKVASILNAGVIPDKAVFSYRDCPNDIYQLSQGMAWNKLYRYEFLQKHNLRFQRIKYTDDAYFTFAYMVLAQKMAVINESLVYYRVSSGSSQTDGLARCPESSYLPYKALKASLIEWGIYDAVKQSFVNCATAFLRYFYEKINTYEAFKYLHDTFCNEVFQLLDIEGHDPDYFYDRRLYQWYKQVADHTAEELAFMAARSYGSDNTTASLRFQFPYDVIARDSRIVLYGAGPMGRHFYSQIMLSGYCDVVLWVEKENPSQLSYIRKVPEIEGAEYDTVLIAYVQPKLIGDAIVYLNCIGVPNEKIIIGGVNT